MYGHDVHTLEANKLAAKARADGWTSLNWIAKNGDMWRLFGVPPGEPKHAWLKDGEAVAFTEPAEVRYSGADGSTIFGAATYPVDTTLNGAQIQAMVDERLMRYSATASSGDYVWIEITVRDADGPPRIRSELGGLMGPGYQATGYEPPPRRQVLLDDPTGDDIAGDVK